MKYEAKTKHQLIEDLTRLRQRIDELEKAEADRKRAEEALKENEERFRTLMEQSPIAIQIMTTDGRIVQVNDAYVKLWEVTLEDVSEYNILQDEQKKHWKELTKTSNKL